MRGLTGIVMIAAVACEAHAQTGNSFVTSDGLNRAPAAALHCIGPGNVAAPCGISTQPLFVVGASPLASAANQITQTGYQQAIASASGSPGDSAYTAGAGSMIALLKGLFTALTSGIIAAPANGTFLSRSAAVPATQSTQLFPPNAARHSLSFQAPQGNSVWVNFLGGVATPNGTDCVQLSAGTLYESSQFVTKGAVTVYAPVAVNIAAWEG